MPLTATAWLTKNSVADDNSVADNNSVADTGMAIIAFALAYTEFAFTYTELAFTDTGVLAPLACDTSCACVPVTTTAWLTAACPHHRVCRSISQSLSSHTLLQ